MVDEETTLDEENFAPGVAKPDDIEGYVWREVKGRDPAKDPNTTSGWSLEKIPENASDEPPFVVPPELKKDGLKATQTDFMDKVDAAREDKTGS